MATILDDFIEKVKIELLKQDEKWGSQREKHPLEWNAILVEEIGEISKEMCDNSFSATLPENYENELVQSVAVLFRMYEQNRYNILGREYFKKDDDYIDEYSVSYLTDEFKFFIDEVERACLDVREGGELVTCFIFDKDEFSELIETLQKMYKNVKE